LPQIERIELHKRTSYSEVDKFIQKISCILTGDLESEEVLPAILKQIGEALNLDRIIVYQLKEESLRVERQWIANHNLMSLAIDLSIREQNRLIPQDNLIQCILEQNLRELEELENNNIVTIDSPIWLGRNLFGVLIFQKIKNKGSFVAEEKYILEKITNQIAIAIKQEIRIKELLLVNYKTNERISNVSHELRTPLTAIIGFAKMLKNQIYGELNDRQLKYITAIYNSGEHLLELINNLLDIAKIEAEKEKLFLEKILIKEICQETLELIKDKAKQQGLQLVFLPESTEVYCTADRGRIKQILVNLLSNAVKFTEKGTITLQVTTTQESTEFAVIDTGIGIKEEDQKKLFEPFSQIVTPLHRKEKGTGLGLVLSQKLARLHGGDISMKSTAGEGSCFTLHLPNRPDT
jgi:signal transduction histidine kinase